MESIRPQFIDHRLVMTGFFIERLLSLNSNAQPQQSHAVKENQQNPIGTCGKAAFFCCCIYLAYRLYSTEKNKSDNRELQKWYIQTWRFDVDAIKAGFSSGFRDRSQNCLNIHQWYRWSWLITTAVLNLFQIEILRWRIWPGYTNQTCTNQYACSRHTTHW